MSKAAAMSVKLNVRDVSPAAVARPYTAVHWWALWGAVWLALQLYVWGSWVTGPHFTPVPTGPSDPPLWMKIALITWGCVAGPITFIVFYKALIKPWLRERRITTDGMLVLAFSLQWFQDPLLNYTNTWCTYNSWLWNMGSWVQDVPGWLSWGEPGAMMAEPILIASCYLYVLFLWCVMACWVTRKAKERWPQLTTAGQVGVLLGFNIFADVIIEGGIFMPLGVYVYSGAIQSLSFFPGKYYQYPVYEGIMWGTAMAGMSALRYFKDDRGRTFAERGLERVQGGVMKLGMLRFLAIYGVISMFFLVCYNIPAQWFGAHADPWPEDIQKRSYFTNGICGEGTGRLCPDPALGIPRGEASIAIGPDGNIVIPEGTRLPKIIPYERPE